MPVGSQPEAVGQCCLSLSPHTAPPERPWGQTGPCWALTAAPGPGASDRPAQTNHRSSHARPPHLSPEARPGRGQARGGPVDQAPSRGRGRRQGGCCLRGGREAAEQKEETGQAWGGRGVKAADGDPRVLGSWSVHSRPWVAALLTSCPTWGPAGASARLSGPGPVGTAASSKAQAERAQRGGVEGAEAQSR